MRLSLLVLLSSSLCAGQQFADTRQLYFDALEGKEGTLARSVELLEGLSRDKPGDPVIAAYLGSARLLESSRAKLPWRKGKLARQGLALLDRAVAASPDNPEIRFLRGVSTFHLPSAFGFQAKAADDLARAATRAEAAVTQGSLQPRIAAAALFYHGLALEKASDTAGARAAWAAAARISPTTRAGIDAARKLGRSVEATGPASAARPASP